MTSVPSEPEIDITMLSISNHNINRPEFLHPADVTAMIWTSMHEVNMMARMGLENYHWYKHLVQEYLG